MIQVTYGLDKAHFIKRENGQVLISIRQLNAVFMKVPKTRQYKSSHQHLLAKMRKAHIRIRPAGAGEQRLLRQHEHEIFGPRGAKAPCISLITVGQAERLMLYNKLVEAHGIFTHMVGLVPSDSQDDVERRKSARHVRTVGTRDTTKRSNVWTRGQVQDLVIIQRRNRYYASMSQAQYTFNGVGKVARFKRVKYELANKSEVAMIRTKYSLIASNHSTSLIDLDDLIDVLTESGHKSAACQVERIQNDMQHRPVVEIKTITNTSDERGQDDSENMENMENMENTNADEASGDDDDDDVSQLKDEECFDTEMQKRQQGCASRVVEDSRVFKNAPDSTDATSTAALALVALADPSVISTTAMTIATTASSSRSSVSMSSATRVTDSQVCDEKRLVLSNTSNAPVRNETESQIKVTREQEKQCPVASTPSVESDNVVESVEMSRAHVDVTTVKVSQVIAPPPIEALACVVDTPVNVQEVKMSETTRRDDDIHTVQTLVQTNMAKFEKHPLVVQECERKEARVYDPAWVTATCMVLFGTSTDTSNHVKASDGKNSPVAATRPLSCLESMRLVAPEPANMSTVPLVQELAAVPAVVSQAAVIPVTVSNATAMASSTFIPSVTLDDVKANDTRVSLSSTNEIHGVVKAKTNVPHGQTDQNEMLHDVLMWLSDEYAPDKNTQHDAEHYVMDEYNHSSWSDLVHPTMITSSSSMDIDFDSLTLPLYSLASTTTSWNEVAVNDKSVESMHFFKTYSNDMDWLMS